MVGGVSLSRMSIGTNRFLGYSRAGAAEDDFIESYQARKNLARILTAFFDEGAIGAATPDDAREVIDLSRAFLAQRLPDNRLQKTRGKRPLRWLSRPGFGGTSDGGN